MYEWVHSVVLAIILLRSSGFKNTKPTYGFFRERMVSGFILYPNLHAAGGEFCFISMCIMPSLPASYRTPYNDM